MVGEQTSTASQTLKTNQDLQSPSVQKLGQETTTVSNVQQPLPYLPSIWWRPLRQRRAWGAPTGGGSPRTSAELRAASPQSLRRKQCKGTKPKDLDSVGGWRLRFTRILFSKKGQDLNVAECDVFILYAEVVLMFVSVTKISSGRCVGKNH